MRVTIEIDDKRVSDLLHGHAGGYSPWMHELSGEWNKGGAKVRFDREQDDEGAGKGKMNVGRLLVRRGLTIMAKECPNRWADFMGRNDDDLAFDCAWQCIIFGKVVYA